MAVHNKLHSSVAVCRTLTDALDAPPVYAQLEAPATWITITVRIDGMKRKRVKRLAEQALATSAYVPGQLDWWTFTGPADLLEDMIRSLVIHGYVRPDWQAGNRGNGSRLPGCDSSASVPRTGSGQSAGKPAARNRTFDRLPVDGITSQTGHKLPVSGRI